MADEFDQYKTKQDSGDEFDQFKSTTAHKTPPKKPTSFWSNPRQFLMERAQQLMGTSQELTNKAIGPESQTATIKRDAQGKPVGYNVTDKPLSVRLGDRVVSLLPETAAVMDKVVAGLMDWKTAAAVTSGLADPAIPAAYFMAYGTGQLTGQLPGVKAGDTSPENVQNALLAGSMVAGGASGAESPSAGRAARGAEKAVDVAKGPQVLKRTAQEILNIGPRQTEKAVAEASEKYQADTEKAEAKNAEAAKKHTQAVVETGKVNQAAKELESRKGALARGVQTLSTKFSDGIKRLDAEIRGKGNAKYDAVREKVKDDEGVPLVTLSKDAKYAEDNIIKGSQENIKQFRELIRKAPEAEGVETSAGFAQPGDPLYDQLVSEGAINTGGNITFDQLQGYSSEIGSKLARGGLPGDVYQALKYMKDKIDAQKGVIANRNDAGADLKSADAYWRQYMETFHDSTGPSGSASPIAQALLAKDPDVVTGYLTGSAGERGIELLGKYDKDWTEIKKAGDPSLVEAARQIRRSHDEMKGLPDKARTKEPPAKPEKETVPPPEVNPRELKADKAQKTISSWRDPNKRDLWIVANSTIAGLVLGHPLAGAMTGLLAEIGMKSFARAIDTPKVIEWLSEPQPKDLEALERLPNDVQSGAANNVRQFINDQGKQGNPVKVAESVKSWLSRFPVAGSAGSVSGNQRKKLLDRGHQLVHSGAVGGSNE